MQTSCPISTISFNTPNFLHYKLCQAQADGIISFWAYFVHKPEDDECGNKEHIHVYVEPSSRLNTDDLNKLFFEFDPEVPDKPRKCISWRKSSTFGDWYLYGLHDKAYLASKGQSRRFHYEYADCMTSDEDDLYYQVNSIDLTALSPYASIIDAINNGIKWEQYFMRGHIPIQQLSAYKSAFDLLESEITYRNGRQGHE